MANVSELEVAKDAIQFNKEYEGNYEAAETIPQYENSHQLSSVQNKKKMYKESINNLR